MTAEPTDDPPSHRRAPPRHPARRRSFTLGPRCGTVRAAPTFRGSLALAGMTTASDAMLRSRPEDRETQTSDTGTGISGSRIDSAAVLLPEKAGPMTSRAWPTTRRTMFCYVFSGKCCTANGSTDGLPPDAPSRRASARLVAAVETDQRFHSRRMERRRCVVCTSASDRILRTYEYASNALGQPFQIADLTGNPRPRLLAGWIEDVRRHERSGAVCRRLAEPDDQSRSGRSIRRRSAYWTVEPWSASEAGSSCWTVPVGGAMTAWSTPCSSSTSSDELRKTPKQGLRRPPFPGTRGSGRAPRRSWARRRGQGSGFWGRGHS